MEDQIYIVTLYDREELQKFYNEMQLTGFPLVLKRPMSRNTHYMMTAEQAEKLRQDPRVWGVERADDLHVRSQNIISINNEPYSVDGDFSKSGSNSSYFQWGHLHCAGTQAQRRKGSWGSGVINDGVNVFNSGKHVDVVIVDDPMGYDAEEWYSPSTGATRFVQYQWFNELNTIVNSIDDDFQSEPTGTITYHQTASNPDYHGMHVGGTVAGQHYGWAREANIYNVAVTGSWQSGQSIGPYLIYDYLRAFHKNKPVNPETGERNPTITNHSYGGIYYTPNENLQLSDISNVVWQGVTYTSSSPGPSGWTTSGLSADFGIRFGVDTIPAYSAGIAADVQDAIDDGVVIIGAAGNDNMLIAAPGDDNWNNTATIGGSSRYLCRGAWPNTPDTDVINVGALDKSSNFKRATFTQFGPGVDVFAPGVYILSSFNNQGFTDSKYTQGSGNYYYPIQGTSMASPQVCGVMACLATGKRRFTNADVRGYLEKMSIKGDMTFDINGGGLGDNTCRQGSPNMYLHIENPRQASGFISDDLRGKRTTGMTFPRKVTYYQEPFTDGSQTYEIAVGNVGASHYVMTGNHANGSFANQNDPPIYLNVGDTVIFNVTASGHPFWIKFSPSTGVGNSVSVGTTGQGTTNGPVTWDTTGAPGGTYYYICQYHGSMYGPIILSP